MAEEAQAEGGLLMADDREVEMLELMRECQRVLRRTENTINEIWAEWTRTHGLSIPGKHIPEPCPFCGALHNHCAHAKGDGTYVKDDEHRVSRRVVKR